MRSSSLAFLRPPVLAAFEGELEADEDSSRSFSSSSLSSSSWASSILRFFALDVESGRRDEDGVADDDDDGAVSAARDDGDATTADMVRWVCWWW